MAITALATEADLQFIWSAFGLTARLDDDLSGASDAGFQAAALESSTVDVLQILLQRYPLSEVNDCSWVRWCMAYFAARKIGNRKGLVLPSDLVREIDEYKQQLERLRDDPTAHLIKDDGSFAIPRFSSGPMVSNFLVDGRQSRQKVRRVASTSTGAAAPSGIRQAPESPFYLNHELPYNP